MKAIKALVVFSLIADCAGEKLSRPAVAFCGSLDS